jgi:hypothetical protein
MFLTAASRRACFGDFRIASLIAFKNGFRESALVSISH